MERKVYENYRSALLAFRSSLNSGNLLPFNPRLLLFDLNAIWEKLKRGAGKLNHGGMLTQAMAKSEGRKAAAKKPGAS
jgi:hypothetical protein